MPSKSFSILAPVVVETVLVVEWTIQQLTVELLCSLPSARWCRLALPVLRPTSVEWRPVVGEVLAVAAGAQTSARQKEPLALVGLEVLLLERRRAVLGRPC
ncbi:unnamed protein product [Polarella glacialis]|uniref:Uncharacterized protein n=1 Tax=Polarella glacialis TaxID=89957 RepID=A0A813LZH4_POLGL|nr:unnamed protein product [Polarella glacialis]CAE8742436.1 unnamed protein product [Polarella glacialis]